MTYIVVSLDKQTKKKKTTRFSCVRSSKIMNDNDSRRDPAHSLRNLRLDDCAAKSEKSHRILSEQPYVSVLLDFTKDVSESELVS
jgi:hypothetical protein